MPRKPRPKPRRDMLHKPPGTLSARPDAIPSSFSGISYNATEFNELGVDEMYDRPASGRTEWINVRGLKDIEPIQQLGEAYGLHKLALEDTLNGFQRPKCEAYEGHLFFVAKMVRLKAELEVEQLSLYAGPNWVITFQENAEESLSPIRERLQEARGRIRAHGAGYLAYAILDSVIDSYYPVLDAYSERLDQLEDRIFEQGDDDVNSELHNIKRELLQLRRSIAPLRDALNHAIRDELEPFDSSSLIYLRDCYDHVIQIVDTVESLREMSADLKNAYLAVVSNRMNEVMKVLTIIATIFMPLGFIAGLYGMNFDSSVSEWNMPELKWVFGYPIALGLMAGMVVGMLIFFRRKGWLGGGPGASRKRGDS